MSDTHAGPRSPDVSPSRPPEAGRGGRVDETETAPTDEQLAVRAAGGDERAWQRLDERSRGHLVAHAHDEGFEERAEDLAQEALIRAWSNLEDYDPDRAPFRAWLRTILRNLLRSQYRSDAAQSHLRSRAETDGGSGLWHGTQPLDPSREAEVREAYDRFLAWLHAHREEDREAFLAHAEGARFVDLAREWGVSASTLRGRDHRVRQKLAPWREKPEGRRVAEAVT